MKGYVAVDIPTKRYIKAFLIARLGEKPLMLVSDKFGNKLFDLLISKRNERKTSFSNFRYNTTIRIYINRYTFRLRGANLNESNIKTFNRYVEKEIKDQFYFLMDFYIEMLPSFSANLPQVRAKLGIDLEDWDDESMKKDYYRYRKATGKPLLYERGQPPSIPHPAF